MDKSFLFEKKNIQTYNYPLFIETGVLFVFELYNKQVGW